MRGGATKLQGCFGRDRFNVGNTADAVSPENFLLLGHGVIETLEGQFVNGKLLSIVIPSAVEEPLTFSLTRCRLDFGATFYLDRDVPAVDNGTSGSAIGQITQSGAVAFATTHWSVVLAAQGESTEAKAALEKLCRTYWWPLYGFVRRQGYKPEDAQDLTQAFFARLLERRDLETVRQERGRLRSYLLASLKNFLSKARHRELTVKRGEGRPLISLEDLLARERGSHLRASLGINIIGASARAARCRI
jgi:hypothetical protein